MIHLPRHLRDVHKWTKEQAKKATSRFRLRKSFLPKVSQQKVQQLPGKTSQEKKEKIIADIGGVLYMDAIQLLSACQIIYSKFTKRKKSSPVYKQLLREARSLKTWQSSPTAQDNPSVKGESSFNNLTEEESTEDGSVQDLQHRGPYEDEDDEEHEVENEETEELQEGKEEVEILKSFCQWLQIVDGGKRNKNNGKTALLAVAQDPFHN